MSGVTPCSPHSCAKHRRNASTAGSSTPPDARSSSGVCGMKRWMVRTGEPIAAANRALRVDALACLGVEPVDPDEGAAGPGHGRLGGQRDLVAGRVDGAAHDVGGALRGRVVAHVAGHEAQLEAGPRAAGEPLGDLISLGSGLEQRDGGGASRHMS